MNEKSESVFHASFDLPPSPICHKNLRCYLNLNRDFNSLFQFVHSDDLVATRQYDRITNYLLPQQRESFIEIIENIAKQTIQLAKDAIKVLQSRIEQLFQDIYEKVFGIQQMGDDALNTILSDIEKLSGNNQKGVTSCIQDKMGEMKQIVLNGREDISKCIQIATGEAANIRESLVPYVESISTLITNITGVIGKCSTSSNPVSSAICITQHVRYEIQFFFERFMDFFFFFRFYR